MSFNKKGSLAYIELKTESKTPATSPEKTFILFHGFGADAYDLQSLAEALKVKGPVRWIFPQGILEVPIGPGWTGRAWWQIDMARLDAGVRNPDFTIADEIPAGLPSLRTKVDELIRSLGVKWSDLILGGFSQGAMLATDTFLRAPENAAGLVLFSGALINKIEWKSLAPQRKGCRFFQSHGKQDAVLPFRVGSQLESMLIGAGMKGSLYSFDGSHEIPWNAIEKANAYLSEI